MLDLLDQLHGNLREVESQFRFNVLAADPDDNKFSDCAIAVEADFVVTDDSHFAALNSAGYKPKAITPDEFIRKFLAD